MPPYNVFRAVGLPANATIYSLEATLKDNLDDGDQLQLISKTSTIVPCCASQSDAGSVTAIFEVKPREFSFPGLQTPSPPEQCFRFSMESKGAALDQGFLGFTQMYRTPGV